MNDYRYNHNIVKIDMYDYRYNHNVVNIFRVTDTITT